MNFIDYLRLSRHSSILDKDYFLVYLVKFHVNCSYYLTFELYDIFLGFTRFYVIALLCLNVFVLEDKDLFLKFISFYLSLSYK